MTHPPSGETLTLPMPWPITRPGDQGRRAAHTYALKQALIDLLGIADGDPEARATPEPPTMAPQSHQEPPRERSLTRLWAKLTERGLDRDSALEWVSRTVGRDITSSKQLSPGEITHLIEQLGTSDA